MHVRIASPPLKHPCYMGINIACFTGACQDSVATPQAPLLHGHQHCLFYRCSRQAPLLHSVRIALPPLKHPCYMGHCYMVATPQAPLACFTGAHEDSVATPQAPLLHGYQHCLFYRCSRIASPPLTHPCTWASTLLVLQVHVRIALPPLKHPCYMGHCLFYRCTSG